MPAPKRRTAFATKLVKYRSGRRMTQPEFAAELGINHITLSRYERDISPVGKGWVADDLERMLDTPVPRTRAELDAQIEAAQLEPQRPGASRDVVVDPSAEEGRPAKVPPKRRPRGQGRA